MNALLLGLLLSCGGADPDTGSPPTADTATGTTDLTLAPLFSFAIFADPHVTASNLEHQERLAAAVAWVNAHAEERNIALVWVVGDIGWSGGLEISRSLLEDLGPTWVPVLGDNEVHLGAEQTFDEVFADQYALLEATMDGWTRGTVAVHDPVLDRDLRGQSLAELVADADEHHPGGELFRLCSRCPGGGISPV